VYVVDGDQRFVGAVPMLDLAPVLKSTQDDQAPWPASLVRVDYPRVLDTTPLWQVLETFARHPGERVPVLDAAGRLLGHITKTDIVLMFRERLGTAA
jgi:CIC family chloride channel protein